MIPRGAGVRAFAYCAAVDMRKGFEGLWALATQELGRDVLSGELFVFVGRDRRRAQVLFFDGTGLWVCVKRLEKGTFAWPSGVDVENGKLRLGAEALALLLDGVDLKGAKMRPWYQRE